MTNQIQVIHAVNEISCKVASQDLAHLHPYSFPRDRCQSMTILPYGLKSFWSVFVALPRNTPIEPTKQNRNTARQGTFVLTKMFANFASGSNLCKFHFVK